MICLNLDLCFHLWGSQQFEVMPGAKKTVEYFLQREMTGTGLTEDELFEYREDEYPQIRGGTVSLIPREDKERVLDLLQECLRFRIELGALVSYVRGDLDLHSQEVLTSHTQWCEPWCIFQSQP